MILEFEKGINFQISKNFNSKQFDCPCKSENCKTTYIADEMITGLETLWGLVGEFKITSGFRCTAHNKAVGGKAGSQHLTGKAVDIVAKASPQDVVKSAEYLSIFRNGGIGKGKTFTHLDCRGYAARWTY